MAKDLYVRTTALGESFPPDRLSEHVVTQLVTQRSVRSRPHHRGRDLTCEPPKGIEPLTCVRAYEREQACALP